MPDTYAIDDLDALAAAILADVPPHGIIWLSGAVGSGKTTFAQALARAAGADGATSPTFALVHEYASAHGPLYHVDCYRLRTADEAVDLALDDLVSDARLIMIEWPEKAADRLPPPDVHLCFTHEASAASRTVERVT